MLHEFFRILHLVNEVVTCDEGLRLKSKESRRRVSWSGAPATRRLHIYCQFNRPASSQLSDAASVMVLELVRAKIRSCGGGVPSSASLANILQELFVPSTKLLSLVAALARPHLHDRHQGADETKFIWYTRLVTTIKVSISPVLGQRALACRPSRVLSHKVDFVSVLVPYDITTRYHPALRRQGYLNLQSHRCAGSVLLGEGLGLSVLLVNRSIKLFQWKRFETSNRPSKSSTLGSRGVSCPNNPGDLAGYRERHDAVRE